MQVRNYMTGAAAVTHPDEPVVAAARLMRMRGIGALPVCEDDGTLAGMLTDRDIARSGKWDMECAQALCGITANVCRR